MSLLPFTWGCEYPSETGSPFLQVVGSLLLPLLLPLLLLLFIYRCIMNIYPYNVHNRFPVPSLSPSFSFKYHMYMYIYICM